MDLVIKDFMFDLHLSGDELLVYAYLYRLQEESKDCPNCEGIAKDLKISTRTVYRAINNLKAKELIQAIRSYRLIGN